MSTLKVGAIRGVSASSDAVTVANDGTCTANITNNLTNRNLIINGAMQIAQRGTSSAANGFGSIDRYSTNFDSGLTEAPTQSQIGLSSSDTPYASGFRHAFRLINGNQTSQNANDYINVTQKIEATNLAQSGWNYTSSSSYITLSFWIKASIAQTMYMRLEDPDGSRIFAFAVSVTTSWQKITKTIPGDSNVAFNNDNGIGLSVRLIPFYGTSYTASGVNLDSWIADSGSAQIPDMANTWFSGNDATLDYTGLQLEVGSVATDFEHRSLHDELLRCKRYFNMVNGGINSAAVYGIAYADSNAHIIFNYPVEMRAAATAYLINGTNYWDHIRYSSTVDLFDNILQNVSTDKNHMELMASGNMSNGGYSGIIRPRNAAARLGFDAEL